MDKKKIIKWVNENRDLLISSIRSSKGFVSGKALCTTSKEQTIDDLVEDLTFAELQRQHPNRDFYYDVEIKAVRQKVKEELFL